MYLFILESIGTSELILVGIVALIFLGPRKLPEYAKKIGKITAEFRGTAHEFKETWEREASFQEEIKSLDLNELDKESAADRVIGDALGDHFSIGQCESTRACIYRDVVNSRPPADLRKARSAQGSKIVVLFKIEIHAHCNQPVYQRYRFVRFSVERVCTGKIIDETREIGPEVRGLFDIPQECRVVLRTIARKRRALERAAPG